MLSSSLFPNSISSISTKLTTITPKIKSTSTNFRAILKPPNSAVSDTTEKPRVLLNSLRVLEWDKLCDAVSSFAGTSIGRQASKEQLEVLDQTYEESLRLLNETNAAVEIHKYSSGIMEFASIDALLVRSGIDHVRRSSPLSGQEAIAVVVLLQFAEALQLNIKAAIRENADLYDRFVPLVESILNWVISKSLVKSVLRVVSEDGSIKDSASGKLQQARLRVLNLESKLYQLMNTLISNEADNTTFLEASNVGGRWCIRSGAGQTTNFKGLLLSSGAGAGKVIEPVSAVLLNDELLEAKASVANAEAEILLDLTEKMKLEVDDIESLLKSIVELDVINARASYGLSLGGTFPSLLPLDGKNVALSSEGFSTKDSSSKLFPSTKKQWKLYLPKAYHPLLLQRHRHNLLEARKEVANAKSELRRRRLYGENFNQQGAALIDIEKLQEKVTQVENSRPIPSDFLIANNTSVLLITGPNTGGKTICLKAVGLAAMMAKAGLFVLCSEPAHIPWFDSVLADIGDDQSLSQSLSTFSGHLRQISDIQVSCTSRSLVLLDEVGAGTNPLEGAALGMSILESFAEARVLLTIATTHHGELKTLKYSNDVFENACMEFDDINLKPTYKILWGVPGRSNAINIAKRLGLPQSIVSNASELYGTASAEIDEVIFGLEKFKHDVEEYVHEAQHYFKLSRELHEKVLLAQRIITDQGSDLKYRKMQEISELTSVARSTLHMKMREYRESARVNPQPRETDTRMHGALVNSQRAATTKTQTTPSLSPGAEKKIRIPKIGDIVHVNSLGTKAKVLQVEPSKEEIVVQAGNLKLKLKFSAVKT
ncbi:uncharacterized protein LOC141657140 isoform X2 [Silene latifolia]|uniref:uncharacterized protein LOC141657140 isoform X2 n=1 Tax=Silene latifolia TaxID=37657 RepID=UPI003D76D929